jgi:hypothetical protein
MMELGHRETKPVRKRLELSVEENKSKTKGVRLSGDIAQLFYHLVKERIIGTRIQEQKYYAPSRGIQREERIRIPMLGGTYIVISNYPVAHVWRYLQ